ncbi:cytochrome c [Alisedimentitalea sp. MJ-SS2]|uniref:c-type cytochrome n=1 Tax=Aliisedimentitalea sp. MJ-SS2 TaxID=3049795 RepID=UPI00290C482D|nr:cytochrome c [Alisedimentitalea sp. MJ-SS2]MDU8928604.1 cytochrome c [Alisedimentitalea sp. MJ-SS2]
MRKTLIAALVVAPVLAHAGPAEDTVAARQGFYKLLGANMGILAAMAKGERDYEGAAAETAANNIVLLTTYNLGHLYMPGTSSAEIKGSRAKPAIWNEFTEAQKKADALFEAANKLTEVAGFDKADMVDALEAVGGACKSCHDNYRED